MSFTKTKDHVHDFKSTTKRVPLHTYKRNGKIKGSMVGVDTLKQFKCECGAVRTSDLERRLV
jgi:hypothetical protein